MAVAAFSASSPVVSSDTFHAIGPDMPSLCVEIDVTNLPTNPSRIWTDVTTLVRQLTFTRSGKNDELQRTATGTISCILDNNADAVTSLGIQRAQWIRVRAQWAGVTYARWQGVIEQLPRSWPSAGKDALIKLTGSDVLKVLRLFDLNGLTFPSQRNDQRVASLCASASIPTGTIDTDTDLADPVLTAFSPGSDALSYALQVEASENGQLIADPEGTISFQGRHWRILHSSTPVAALGETFGIRYRDSVELTSSDIEIANVVNITPVGATSPITVTDATSKGKYWTRPLNRTLMTSSTVIATDAANYLLARYKDPSPRLPSAELVMRACPSYWPTVLGLRNSSRLTWTRQAKTPISMDVFVEQITETIIPGTNWIVTLKLSPAADATGWVLGDAVYGILDTTTKLVY